jgi:MFS family permease
MRHDRLIAHRLGTGFTWLPATPILPQWFNKNRSLAQGIAAAGSGTGGIIFSAATTPMIQNISLAWSLRITGILAFVVLVTATTLIRSRNEMIRPRFKALDTDLLKRYRVWLLIGYSFFSILGYIVAIYSLGKNIIPTDGSEIGLSVQNRADFLLRCFCDFYWP